MDRGPAQDPADSPRVLVVIVTHRSSVVVGECIEALDAAAGTAAHLDVVVVDNGSPDDTVAVVRAARPGVDVVMQANHGYAAGINAGVAEGLRPDTAGVLVLNADVRLRPGSVGPLLAAAVDPSVGIVAPRLVEPDGRVLRSLRREPNLMRSMGDAVLGGDRAGRLARWGETVIDEADYARAHDADWVTGAALYLTRDCLERVGPWDETFFLYSEETDYCLRARDAGFRVRYEPAAEAVHLGGESNESPALWSLLIRNRLHLERSRRGVLAALALACVLALGEGLRALAGRATSRAALRGLVRRRSSLVRAIAGAPPRGVVCFSAQDWWYFSHGHSDFQLMTRLAVDRPVLFVNSLGMRMPRAGTASDPWARIARKIRSATRGLATPLPDVPGFHVLTPVFLPLYGDDLAGRANRALVRAQVRVALWRLGLRLPDVVVTLPTAWPVAEGLRRRRTVAYRSDRYSAMPEADTELVARLERDLLAGADLACFASAALRDEEGGWTRSPRLLRHGIDIRRFRPAAEMEVHPVVAAVAGPRVGFVGTLDAYTVDSDLLAAVARHCPDAALILMGRVDTDLSELLSLPNVHHLGEVGFDEVPSVMAGLDVALMPWLDNTWIRHCNPVKLKEYLAVGLPVVSTDFPEVHRYADVIAVAADRPEFLDAVRVALDGHAPSSVEGRRAAVAEETWDDQARRLAQLLEDPSAVTDTDGEGRRCVDS